AGTGDGRDHRADGRRPDRVPRRGRRDGLVDGERRRQLHDRGDRRRLRRVDAAVAGRRLDGAVVPVIGSTEPKRGMAARGLRGLRTDMENRSWGHAILPVLVLALGASCAGDPPGVTIEKAVSLPARVQGTLTTASCAVATTGPMITLTGELALGGMSANVVFRNNQKG